MKMDDFLGMSYQEALKLYADIFQGSWDNHIQSGEITYAITNGFYMTGLEEKVILELENISRSKTASTERTIKIEFRGRRYA